MRIAPSLLSADFARLGEEVTAVIDAGADLIHFDVMDNHYVPNLTVGPLVCQAIKPYAVRGDQPVPIDVHLMVKPVDALIPMFAQAGASLISFHPEASEHIDRTVQLIRSLGMKAGLVLNPATPLHCLDHVLEQLDLVLEVDGGIKADNAQRVGNAGADTLVAGSAVFSGGRYRESIAAIRDNALAGQRLRKIPARRAHDA